MYDYQIHAYPILHEATKPRTQSTRPHDTRSTKTTFTIPIGQRDPPSRYSRNTPSSIPYALQPRSFFSSFLLIRGPGLWLFPASASASYIVHRGAALLQHLAAHRFSQRLKLSFSPWTRFRFNPVGCPLLFYRVRFLWWGFVAIDVYLLTSHVFLPLSLPAGRLRTNTFVSMFPTIYMAA